jgi:meiotically up-regulated gene 157 (Mug157) protein
MATTIKKITAKRDADIETVIKEVMDKQPTTVIIFGYCNGSVEWRMSGAQNRFELIGALEMAKQRR